MQSSAKTVEVYLNELPEERKTPVNRLREVILQNLARGFNETMDGMIVYVVPLTAYPQGYLNNPTVPLPFLGIASQKHFIAVYHMGLAADKQLLEWFKTEYPKHCKAKLDMGKCCIRFKKTADIPFDLIGKLAGKTSAKQWIELYEQQRNDKTKH